MDSEHNLAYILGCKVKNLCIEMNNSYEMLALYGGMIDFEGNVVSPNEMDPRNINLEESVRHSIRVLGHARAIEELIGLGKDLCGDIPEIANIEDDVKKVIANVELLNKGFIEKYTSIVRGSDKRKYSFLNNLYSLVLWKRKKK